MALWGVCAMPWPVMVFRNSEKHKGQKLWIPEQVIVQVPFRTLYCRAELSDYINSVKYSICLEIYIILYFEKCQWKIITFFVCEEGKEGLLIRHKCNSTWLTLQFAMIRWYSNTLPCKKFGVGKILLMLCSPRLHLFNQNYSKTVIL